MRYVVTGANRGIGLEFVKQLSDRGDEVIATVRKPAEAKELAAVAEASGGKVRVAPLEITDAQSVASFAAWLGEEPVDVLVNNAGRLSFGGGLGAFDFEAMRDDFETNVVGTLRVTEALLGNLKAGEGRKVMNISSKMGSIAENTSGGVYPYRMSKAALNMATRTLANDLRPKNITVLTVHPGWVQTDMGGPNALIDTQTSVSGLLSVLDGAGSDASGRFWEWKGDEIAW